MITINNLRIEHRDSRVLLIADIFTDNPKVIIPQSTIWFSVPEKYNDILDFESYNAFLLVPYFLCIYYNEDLNIEGSVSKQLYFNLVNYISKIFCDFCGVDNKVSLIVDKISDEKRNTSIVGSSCSCGVDSLCTIMDRFVEETDINYRINSLFFFNCGTHGDYDDDNSRTLWLDRLALNKKAGEELNLPVIELDSNIHAFTHSIYHNDEPIGYLAIYSCILALGGGIKKYYVSSEFSYAQTLIYGKNQKNIDISGYNGMALIPLIKTENTELVLDGAQYLRSEKLVHISDWEIAHKYLNICINPIQHGRNCSAYCYKCRTALLLLNAIGRENLFVNVFDIKEFENQRSYVKKECMIDYKNNPYVKDSVDFVVEKGTRMPSAMEVFLYRARRKIKRIIKKLF